MLQGMRSRVCFCSVCLLCSLLLFLQFGCSDDDYASGSSVKQMRSENDRAEKEFEAELYAIMQRTETAFQPYRENGLLKVVLTPDGGEVYIDDGFVTIPKAGLMLPVGTYEVKAVWPDGKQASKKVFVTPALQQIISYEWNFKRNTSGGSGNQKANIDFDAPLSPTEVTFAKPGN